MIAKEMRIKMKPIWIKLFALLLCVSMLIGIASCGKDSISEEDAFMPTDPFTETWLIKNGVCPYKIIIPKEASDQINLAASEFQYFFKEATGVELEISTKANDTREKCFSIGPTSLQQNSGVSATSYG